MLFLLQMIEAILQYRLGGIEHLAADLGGRLNAPFIKGLRRNPEARGHLGFVQPSALFLEVFCAHDKTTTNL